MNFIAERLLDFGHFRRGDICARFGISVQQASVDIRKYRADHPGAVRYNASAKRYEKA